MPGSKLDWETGKIISRKKTMENYFISVVPKNLNGDVYDIVKSETKIIN